MKARLVVACVFCTLLCGCSLRAVVRVLDAESGAPLSGAGVRAASGSSGATDSGGRCEVAVRARDAVAVRHSGRFEQAVEFQLRSRPLGGRVRIDFRLPSESSSPDDTGAPVPAVGAGTLWLASSSYLGPGTGTISYPTDASWAGIITGTVSDARSGEALGDALVTVEAAGPAARTDVQGRFRLTGAPAEMHRLRASCPGYGDASVAIRADARRVAVAVFRLQPEGHAGNRQARGH